MPRSLSLSVPVRSGGSARAQLPGLRLAALFLIVAAAFFGLAILLTEIADLPVTVLSCLSAAATLTIIAGAIALHVMVRRPSGVTLDQAGVEALLDDLPLPVLVTDPRGRPVGANLAARALLDLPVPAGREFFIPQDWLIGALAEAIPTNGSVSEELVVHATDERGRTWALRYLSRPGARVFWHVVRTAPEGEIEAEAAFPVLHLTEDGAILRANAKALALLGKMPAHVRDILSDPPAAGTICQATTSQGARSVLLADLPCDGHQRRMALFPLDAATDPASPTTPDWDRFDNLPVPLLWLSTDGRVQKANRTAQALIGTDCLPGTHIGDLTEGLGRPIADWLDETLSGHRPNSPEFLRVTTSEAESFVQIVLKPVTEGQETALLAVLSDATELKTLEAQFVQSPKMQAIGQLAGGVAHDFNNLLTAISGHCDLLLLRHDQGDPDYADLMQINQNANRAAALVSQLLAFSRKQTLRPEEINLRDTVSDLTHLLNRLVGEKITLSFSHDPVLQSIRADKRQLEQVLMNLVVNARDAITGSGEIRIVTERVQYDAPYARDRVTVPPGDYVAVKVIDTGSGIPPDRLSKVFEPFYTTKRIGEGTGLGLSTAYGIIKQTGGYIFVDSTPGEGTCFTLLFRAFKDEQRVMSDIREAAKTSARHADGVVLLVEDEAPVRAFASRALRLRGYTVLEADSGEEALDLLADPETRVDIVVSDVVMPGMDGPTWVRKALEDRPDLRVIFVSGYAEENFLEGHARIPNSIFLPKPFSLSELTQTVQAVAEGQGGDQPRRGATGMPA